jgi:hypothetical protein
MKMDSSKWMKEFEDNPINISERWQLTAGDDKRTNENTQKGQS